MKPSLNTLVTMLLVRPFLGKFARLLGVHATDLIGLVQAVRVRWAEARVARVKVWMAAACQFHDDHLRALDADLTECERRLQELRMAHRLINVKRHFGTGSQA